MVNRNHLPAVCPSCGKRLEVRVLECTCCKTRIEGKYPLPLLVLAAEEQQFLLEFVKCGGSLKELASRLGASYPTVRNRLDGVLARIRLLEKM